MGEKNMVENNEVENYHPKPRKWPRALFTIIILCCYSFVEALLWFLSIFQFFWNLFAGNPNSYISEFGRALAKWNSQAIKYCLFIDDEAPFPFSSWPNIHKR